ncbi:MAG: hypothetical protein PUA47_07190 [Bacteroidales bacterium]|nr:hypothetical protein [Bacteroidales bacterium]
MKKILLFLSVLVMTLPGCTKIIREYKTIYTEIRDTIIVERDTIIREKVTRMYSVQEFGVLPENDPSKNKTNLQAAINWASDKGAALYIDPVENGYRVQSGIILKKNVSLIGVHGPTGRGTVSANGKPTGSLFVIQDSKEPFITVESATQIRGCQFFYPDQPYNTTSGIKNYPPTIQVSHTSNSQGVTLSCLTFYGETFAMDFRADSNHPCEQILFEHCYGYPLSGQFIAIDRCYDIPRILHCHVNPANQREFGKGFQKAVIDYVVSKKTYAFWIDHTDNAQCMDLFTFGTYGGISLGASSYGQLTNFNFDCVCNGIYKDGDSPFNRVWEVAQGSIIANASPSGDLTEIHPVYVTGRGHLSLTNVDCFSGNNGALTNLGQSYDFLKCVTPNYVVVTGVNCRMRNYSQDSAFTVDAPRAQLSFINCADKNGHIFNWSYYGPDSD